MEVQITGFKSWIDFCEMIYFLQISPANNFSAPDSIFYKKSLTLDT